jgi:hypothetical protein
MAILDDPQQYKEMVERVESAGLKVCILWVQILVVSLC